MKRLPALIGMAIAAIILATAPARAATLLYDFENQPLMTETPFTLNSSGIAATFTGRGDDASGARSPLRRIFRRRRASNTDS
jgi:hypothetical protein